MMYDNYHVIRFKTNFQILSLSGDLFLSWFNISKSSYKTKKWKPVAVHFNIRRGNKSNVMDFYQPGSEVIEKFNNAANYAVLLGKCVIHRSCRDILMEYHQAAVCLYFYFYFIITIFYYGCLIAVYIKAMMGITIYLVLRKIK